MANKKLSTVVTETVENAENGNAHTEEKVAVKFTAPVDAAGTKLAVGQVITRGTLHKSANKMSVGVVRQIKQNGTLGVEELEVQADWDFENNKEINPRRVYARHEVKFLATVTVTPLTEAQLLERYPLGPITAK